MSARRTRSAAGQLNVSSFHTSQSASEVSGKYMYSSPASFSLWPMM